MGQVMKSVTEWMRTLPGLFTLLVGISVGTVWAASQHFVTKAELGDRFRTFYIEQLGDKLHELETSDKEALKKYYERKLENLIESR